MSSICKCHCHKGFPWQEINGECSHCKPSVQNEEWKDEFWVKYHATWLKQGRTAEQSYGVTNFMTGQGAKMLEDARKQGQLEAYEKVEGLIGISTENKWKEGSRGWVIKEAISNLRSELRQGIEKLKEEVKQD